MLTPDEPGGDYAMDLGGARLLVAEADADDAGMIMRHLARSEDEQP